MDNEVDDENKVRDKQTQNEKPEPNPKFKSTPQQKRTLYENMGCESDNCIDSEKDSDRSIILRKSGQTPAKPLISELKKTGIHLRIQSTYGSFAL